MTDFRNSGTTQKPRSSSAQTIAVKRSTSSWQNSMHAKTIPP